MHIFYYSALFTVHFIKQITGWKEETWREEIEKHPFFMSKLPEENEELPPLLEAFQQLKYDPEQNTNEGF